MSASSARLNRSSIERRTCIISSTLCAAHASLSTVSIRPASEAPATTSYDMADRQFTRAELEAHNRRGDAWLIIDNLVYDVSDFLNDHPGGCDVLLDNAGKDASQCFRDVGHSDLAVEWRRSFLVGELVEADRREPPPAAAAAEPAREPLSAAAVLHVWGPPLLMALLATALYVYLF